MYFAYGKTLVQTGSDKIQQSRRLSQNGQNAVIILYLNALTDAERQDIRRASWSQDISVAVLDEILFECLARADIGAHWFLGNRLRDFLAVALPYTAANPYNPETTGWGARVPREMFYGREELANNVMKMRDGTSILFGGRQLGKTALLRHVEETFSQPVEKQFAWFIDLKDRDMFQRLPQLQQRNPPKSSRLSTSNSVLRIYSPAVPRMRIQTRFDRTF